MIRSKWGQSEVDIYRTGNCIWWIRQKVLRTRDWGLQERSAWPVRLPMGWARAPRGGQALCG
ncbi:MAG: hypothetical protein AAGI88_22890, partial [Pseudomonadota bacterium]